MSFQEHHLKSCRYCQNIDRATKLAELGHLIRGTSAGTAPTSRAKDASVFDRPKKPGYLERQFKLKELGKLVRGQIHY